MTAVSPSSTVTSEANWRLVRIGMLLTRAAGERFDLEIDVHVELSDFCTVGVAFRVRPRSSYWICGMVMEVPTAALSRLAALTPLMVTPASAEVWAGEAVE